MACTISKHNRVTLFVCRAFDHIDKCEITLSEKFVVASKESKGRGRQDERAGLPNVVELAIGMQVMVTFNVETELDIANGSRGEIVGIILDETRSSQLQSQAGVVELKRMPAYVLVKLHRTKASKLEGLEEGVLPLVPMNRTFCILHQGKEKAITRRQLPLTAAYAFTAKDKPSIK